MAINQNLLFKSKIDELIWTPVPSMDFDKSYLGVMILFSDVTKKDQIFTLLDMVTLSKIRYSLNKYFLLVSSSTDILEYIKSLCKSTIKDGGISIGLSTVSNAVKDIPMMFREADISVYSSFLYNNNDIYVYQKGSYSDIENIVEKISDCMNHKNYIEIIEILKSIPCIFIDRNLSMESVVLLWNQVVALILNNTEKEFLDKEFEFMSYIEIVNKFNSLSELCDYLLKFFLSLHTSINNKHSSGINDNFKKLLDYVNQHYNEELHLKELSNRYFINFTYCCELFRKVTGITFSEYITDLRMEKACELLKNNKDLTISEISSKVGYNDYYYFNRIFKKIYGKTPLGYKRKVG